MDFSKQAKDRLNYWSKRVGIWVGVIAILGAFGTAWNKLDLPVPASAMQVEQLSAKQAEMGVEVYEDKIRNLRKEERDLKMELKAAEASPDKDWRKIEMLYEFIDQVQNKAKKIGKKLTEFEEHIIGLTK